MAEHLTTPDTPPGARLAPIGGGERIDAIDVLRGVALLGIFAMNIPWFALPEHAVFNPMAAGEFLGADRFAWWFGELFFNWKMMAIFSMLFGAGLIVMSSRAEAAGRRPAGVHYRRMGWLLLFGLLHAYLLWEGDILYTYALCGMLVFLLRKLSPRALVTIAIPALAVPVLFNTGFGWLFHLMRESSEAVEAGTAAGWQQGLAKGWEDTRSGFIPSEEALRNERAAFLGSYREGFPRRAAAAAELQLFLFPIWMVWRGSGLMLIGMALLKLRVLTGERSGRFYAQMAALGYGLGLPLVYVGGRRLVAHEFDFVEMFRSDWHFNQVGSIGVALGHVGVVMLLCRSGALGLLRRALGAAGRMAFSNYIMQSFIGATVFYGWGFGLWGSLSHAEFWIVVGVVWALQLVVSPIWLSRFRFGPLEWVWRSLTYGRAQPFRIARA